MKTIQITDEMYEALTDISKELNTQDHRATRMPYMIQVSEKREVAAWKGCGDMHWCGEEGERLDTEEEKNEVIKDYLFDKYGTDDSIEDLADYEKDCILEDLGYRELESTYEDELSNFFFTEKALRDQYGKSVNTFLTGVRNPELEVVMKFLCELTGGKLHT